MSWSFRFQAASKAAALAKIDAEFTRVTSDAQAHEIQRPQLKALAESVIGSVRDDASLEIGVSANGSVTSDSAGVRSNGLSLSAWLTTPDGQSA